MARIRCEQHGIFYDPDGPGCPFCGSTSNKPRTGKGWNDVGVGTRVAAVAVSIILATSFMRTFFAPPVRSTVPAIDADTLVASLVGAGASDDLTDVGGSAELAASVNPAARSERQMLVDLHVVLTTTMESARMHALHISEPVRDRQSPEAVRQEVEWDSVRQSILASLEAASSRIPSSYDWSRDADRALRNMERATFGLARILKTSDLPSRARRESSFNRAMEQLEDTTTYLNRLVQ